MKHYFILCLVLITITSCTSEKEKAVAEKKITDEKATIKYQHSRDRLLKNIAKKHSISAKWDTLSYRYTIDYEPILETGVQVIDHFKIADIYAKDSTLFVSITTGSFMDEFDEMLTFGETSPKFFFDFPITNKQKEILNKSDEDLILVVEIDKLKKIELSLKGESEGEDDVNVFLKNSKNFWGRGKLIEIYSIPLPNTRENDLLKLIDQYEDSD